MISIPYYTSTYDISGDYSHGSLENAFNHRLMMEKIANEICEQAIEEVLKQVIPKLEDMIQTKMEDAYKQALNDVIGVLDYDVESVTKIGFDGCRDIFEDKKAQKYISDHIMKEITKKLSNKHLRK